MPGGQSHSVEELALEVFEITKITWLSASRTKARGRYDLSETEFLALDALEQDGRLTVGQLQRRIGVLPAQMSRIIKRLETGHQKPLVSCAINQDDKRKIDVELTADGRKAVTAFRREKIDQTIASLRSLSPEDVNDLVRIVRVVRKAMNA